MCNACSSRRSQRHGSKMEGHGPRTQRAGHEGPTPRTLLIHVRTPPLLPTSTSEHREKKKIPTMGPPHLVKAHGSHPRTHSPPGNRALGTTRVGKSKLNPTRPPPLARCQLPLNLAKKTHVS